MTSTKSDEINDLLKCEVISISYHFKASVGSLCMGEGNCCDMNGCIAFFEAIDPGVRVIDTHAGGEPDVSYCKRRDGTWTSLAPVRIRLRNNA